MTLRWIWAIVLCLFLNFLGGTQETSIMKQSNSTPGHLLHFLMDGYEAKLRPVRDWKRTTVVHIDLAIMGILAVAEKEQLLTMYFISNQYWRDEFLQWKPKDFDDMTLISVPSETIWIPDIQIAQLVDPGISIGRSYVYIDNTGLVKYQRSQKQSFVCIFYIYFFPFDIHNCTLSFHSQLHTIEHVNLSAWKTENVMEDIFYHKGEWELSFMYPSYSLETDQGKDFALLSFNIIFKRKPVYYIVNLILPSMFLMILDIFGFYIPYQSGERISFKITLLLGYSVFLVVVANNLPASSHATPIIDTFFLGCLVLLGISLVESILVYQIVSNKYIPCKLPTWMKKLVLEKLSIVVRMSNSDWDIEVSEPLQEMSTATSGQLDKTADTTDPTSQSTDMMEMPRDVLEKILKEIILIRQYIRDERHQKTYMEWLLVGYILDKCLFWLYLFFLVIFIFSILICWSKHSLI
ncbi:5-hydroxytryptamine receptor 3A-like [Engystomops pustulosus]|uniref:5-hydroxytryptamine receptor 3A-like n=1 Tax=Engystomops pustulosus TaxID=76066 RepID=UPI003AFA688F